MKNDVLIIEKKGCVMHSAERKDDILDSGTHHQTYGLIGILTIGMQSFVVIITDRDPIARSPGDGNTIYEITSIDFIPFDSNVATYKDVGCQDTLKYLEGVRKVIEEQGFFYSYYSDLSRNLQSFSEKLYRANKWYK